MPIVRLRALAPAAALLLLACGDGADGDPEDAGARDAAAPFDAGPANDAGPDADAGSTGSDAGDLDDGGTTDPDGGGGACEPTGGSMELDPYCDLFELAVIDDGSGTVEAVLYGRVSPAVGEGTCAVLDEVEVLEGGTSIGTLEGVGEWRTGAETALLARGPALSGMVARCDSDENRFGGYGFLVRGRVDGGTFEAACADAEGGGRWPPALRITCHENVEERPTPSSELSVASSSPFPTTAFRTGVRAGTAVTSVDASLHVIPHAYPFGGTGPLSPFDLSLSDTSVGEASAPLYGTYSLVSMSDEGSLLDMELCPILPPTPGPDDPVPPSMIVRLTGSSEGGPFSTEAFVEQCWRY